MLISFVDRILEIDNYDDICLDLKKLGISKKTQILEFYCTFLICDGFVKIKFIPSQALCTIIYEYFDFGEG